MTDPPSAADRVAVVLVCWNGWRDAIECISSLLALDHPRWHLFLVDNDSPDGSLERIREWCAAPRPQAGWRALEGVRRVTEGLAVPLAVRRTDATDSPLPPAPEGCQITLIRSGANRGFAGGCNVGARAAGTGAYDFFWFLNTDTVVHPGALSALLLRAQAAPGIGITGSTILYYDRPDTVYALGGARLEADGVTSRHLGAGLPASARPADAQPIEREMFYVAGASMLVSATFIREIGLMEEDYFLFCEEIDWAVRGRPRFTLAYAPDSLVYHKSGGSTKSAVAFTTRFYYRSRIRFTQRFFPERVGAVRRMLAVELLRHLLRGRWMHAWIVARTLLESRQLVAQMQRSPSGAAEPVSSGPSGRSLR